MRLKLQIRRPELPITRIWWDTTQCLEDKPNATVAHLLQYINEVCPLDYDSLGLEDYVLEKEGYEFVHYQHVGGVLRDSDEIVIRPLSGAEMRERRMAGRSSINPNGRKLLDGIPFGGQFRRPQRSIASRPTPAHKRRRLASAAEDDEDDPERPRRALVRFAEADLEDSDEDYNGEIMEEEDEDDDDYVDGEDEELEQEEIDHDELKALQEGDKEEPRPITPETVPTRRRKRREARRTTPPLAESTRVEETSTDVSMASNLRDHNLPTPELQMPIPSPTVLGKRSRPSTDSASDAGSRPPAKRPEKSVSPQRPLEESEDVPQKLTANQTELGSILEIKMEGDDDDEDEEEFVPDSDEDSDSSSDESSSASHEEVASPSTERVDGVEESRKQEASPDSSAKPPLADKAASKGKTTEVKKDDQSEVESSEQSSDESSDDSDSSDSESDSDSDSESDSGAGNSDDSENSDSSSDSESEAEGTSQDDSGSSKSSSKDSDNEEASEGSDEEKQEKVKKSKLPGPTRFVAATNDALREAKSTSPPHTGNSKTRYRNARKKKRQQLIRLIQQGLLPTGSTLAILNAVQKLVNPSRTIKEACQIYLAEKDGAADGNSAMHLSEEAANGSPSIDSQSFIERQRQPDYSRSNSVLEESQPVTASGPPQKGKVAQKQSNVAEKSFIMANAKYATNKKKGFLQKMKGRERSYQKYDDDGNPIDVQDCNPTPTEDSHFDETAGSGDHWKGKITLSAVEVGQGYEEMIPAPSFPFQHPYLQMKGKKGKKGKKQNRPQQQQEYYDESMYDDSYYAEEAYQEDTQTQTEPEPAVEDLPSLPTDISSLPELTEDNVKEGMVICYKIMEISKSYQPIVSDYRTALVNSIFPDCRGFPEYLGVTLAKRDQPVQEIDPETGEPVRGKFELVDDELSGRAEEAPGYLELEFRDLIEPRILKEPELTPEQQAKFEKAVEWPDLDGRSGKGDENSPPSPPADSHAEGSDDPPTNSGSAQDDGNKDVDMDTNARTHCAEDSLGTGDDQVVHDVQDERESSDQEAANSEGSQNARLEQEVQSAQDAEVSAALADTQVHGLSPQEFGTEEAEGSLADAQLVQEAVERSIEPEAFCADREAAHHPEEANDADHIDGQIAAAESVSDQPVSKESDTQPGDAGKLESEVPVVEHVRVDEVAAEGSSNSQESDDVVIPDSLQQVPHEPNLLTSLSQVVDSQTTSALDPEKVADSQLDEHSRSASPVKIQQPEQTAVNVGDCTALGFDSDFPPSYQPPCSTNDTETSGAALLSDAYTSDLASAKQLSVSMESKETDSTIQADAAGATSEEDDSDVSMDDDEHHEGSQEGSPHSDADQMEVDDASEDENEELQERYADSDIDEDYVGSPVALSNDEAEDLGKAQERAETGLSVRETTPVPQVEERTAAMREAQVAPTEPTTTIASDSSFKIPATPGQDGVGPSLNKAAPSPRLDEVQILTPKELNTPEPTTHSTPPPSSQPVKTPTPKKTETPEVGDLKKGIAKAREVLTGFLSNQPGLLGDVITKGKENDKGSPTGSKNIDILGIRDSLIPGGIAKRKSLPASSPKRSPLKRRTLFDSPSPSRVLSPPKKNRPFKIHDDKENPFAEKQGSVPVRREQPSSSSQPVRTPNEQAHLSSSQPEPPKTSAKARGSSSRSSFISPTDLGEDFANFNNYIPRDSQPLSTLSKSRQSNANMAPSSSAPLTSELRKVKSERSSKSATPVPLPNRASTGKAVMIDLTQMNSDDDLEVDTEKKQDSFLGKGAEKKRTSIGGRPSWARPGQSSGQPKK